MPRTEKDLRYRLANATNDGMNMCHFSQSSPSIASGASDQTKGLLDDPELEIIVFCAYCEKSDKSSMEKPLALGKILRSLSSHNCANMVNVLALLVSSCF